MSNLPIRRTQFNMAGFAVWLSNSGAEVGAPTNPYELIRYRAYAEGGSKTATHIVYTKDNGLLTFCGDSRKHYEAFLGGLIDKLITGPKRRDRRGGSDAARTRRKLLARDGDECWFCGKPMGDDCTIEHLVPKSTGGANRLANYALAHGVCNKAAADKPLVEKIAMRARLRATPEQKIAERKVRG